VTFHSSCHLTPRRKELKNPKSSHNFPWDNSKGSVPFISAILVFTKFPSVPFSLTIFSSSWCGIRYWDFRVGSIYEFWA